MSAPRESSSRAVYELSIVLAFVAGFADAATFVGAEGIFCGQITGNLVVLAGGVVRQASEGLWLRLATFPIFVTAVLVATWKDAISREEEEGLRARRLLLQQALLFGAAGVLGAVAAPLRPSLSRITTVTLLVSAMGLQNTLHRSRRGFGGATTEMAVNVTRWLVELFRPDDAEGGGPAAGGAVIVAFVVGCGVGAVMVAKLGFAALLLPAAIVLFARARADGRQGIRARSGSG